VAPTRPRIVIGGVGHLYQGDLDLGRRAVEQLRNEHLGDDVALEEFSYGAVAVAQRLQELQPELLILIAGKERGRPPGSVERRDVQPAARATEEVQGAIADAVTGYIDVDLVLDVAQGLGVLPRAVVAIEVEPARVDPSETLSPEAESALDDALELVRTTVSSSGILE
jgi:hydrogenase maturation protease